MVHTFSLRSDLVLHWVLDFDTNFTVSPLELIRAMNPEHQQLISLQLTKEHDKLSGNLGELGEEKNRWKKADEEYKLERENLRTNIKHLQVRNPQTHNCLSPKYSRHQAVFMVKK